ncbi:9600_t:CDS:2 [Ambispora leptoticha]|uniref:9600_t:CDS:1 n=1 Tax=Ambispora leptoticha TaxID=144679 RepID=A0A9N9BCJ6_9GLOM|nr:9600_t:CDS:2 [Ambispora leptoticha]
MILGYVNYLFVTRLEKEEKEKLKLDTKEAAAQFWQKFQVERGAITNDIALLSNTTSTSVITKECDKILERINNLEKKLTEATIYLPSYDQRQLSLQIKSMIDELNIRRTLLAPKQKFSFKSRKVATSNDESKKLTTKSESKSTTTTTTSTTISSSSLDSHNDPNLRVITLHNRQKAFLTVNSYLSSSSSISAKMIDVQLSDLTHCVVNLVSKRIFIGAIHVKGLKNSVVVVGPVGSSVLIHDCERCVFVVGCHQFRIHTSKQMIIYLHVTSHPIIEDCHDIQFAPYTIPIDGLDKMFEVIKLDPNLNHYDKVDDFNWHRQQASPNWKLLPEEKILKEWPNKLLDDDEMSPDNNNNNENLSEEIIDHLLAEILK